MQKTLDKSCILHYTNDARCFYACNAAPVAGWEDTMKFGEKLLSARKQLGISRDALSEMTGISKRAIAYYELEGKLPKQRSSVEALAQALRTTPETLMDDNAEFVLRAGEAYGAQGQREAQKLVKQIRSLYAGGSLNEKDIDAMMLAIQDAYWIAKKKLMNKDDSEADEQ